MSNQHQMIAALTDEREHRLGVLIKILESINNSEARRLLGLTSRGSLDSRSILYRIVRNMKPGNAGKNWTFLYIGACRDLFLAFGDVRFPGIGRYAFRNDVVVMEWIPNLLGRSSNSIVDCLHRIASPAGKKGDMTRYARRVAKIKGYDIESTGTFFQKVQIAPSPLNVNRPITGRDLALERHMYRQNKKESHEIAEAEGTTQRRVATKEEKCRVLVSSPRRIEKIRELNPPVLVQPRGLGLRRRK